MKLCVIPARGGSKRIPGKNIRNFRGKPIIAYSIETAINSSLFDRVIVSTDDKAIADVARKYGADAPFLRPARLADDYTGTAEVVEHTIQWCQKAGDTVDTVCCVYATAPFLHASYLRAGLAKLTESGKSFVFSVTSFPFPIQRSIRLLPEGGVEPFFPEYISARSQDLEEAFHDAGQFYWGTAEAWLENKPLFSGCSDAIVIPRHLVQDIDTTEDWIRAELMHHALQLANES